MVLVLAGAGCDAGGAHEGPPPAGAPSSDAGANDAASPSGCSFELCMPYTCDSRFDSCRTTCSGSDQCVEGYACRDGFCVGMECSDDEDAGTSCGAYACVLGRCVTDCALGPCAPGFYCRGDTSQCMPRCTTREDARCAGYVCDLEVGECEAYCSDGELACAAGYACSEQGACEERL